MTIALCLIAWLSFAPVAAYLMGREEIIDCEPPMVLFFAITIGPPYALVHGIHLAYAVGREHGERQRRSRKP